MKKVLFFVLLLLFSATGCNLREREKKLEQRELELSQKEQELLLKERTLTLKEEELARRQQKLDSSILTSDTAAVFNSALVGLWAVEMTCTETTCTGFAVGDVKKEQWEISYQGSHVIAKAMVGTQLVRVYSGIFNGAFLELLEDKDKTPANPAPNMVVRLHIVNEKQLEGTRESTREGNCKVVYALQLTKQ